MKDDVTPRCKAPSAALRARVEFISNDAAFELSQTLKAGTFQFGDGQGAATHKFANLVIERHERMRAAAPEMFETLLRCEQMMIGHPMFNDPDHGPCRLLIAVSCAILKVTSEPRGLSAAEAPCADRVNTITPPSAPVDKEGE